jgi:hypothetical protein
VQTQFSQGMLPGAPFAATFLLLAAIAVLFGCLTALNTGLPGKPTPTEEAAAAAAAKAVTGGVSVRQLLRNPGFVAAVASQSGGYFAMIFTMTSCPLAMAARCARACGGPTTTACACHRCCCCCHYHHCHCHCHCHCHHFHGHGHHCHGHHCHHCHHHRHRHCHCRRTM